MQRQALGDKAMKVAQKSALNEAVSIASLGLKVWRGQPRRMERPHIHTDLEVNLLVEGQARYFFADRFLDLTPGAFTVFWAGAPHHLVEVGPGTTLFWVTAPLPWVLSWGMGDSFVRRLLGGAVFIDPETTNGRGALAIEQLSGWERDLDAGGAEGRRIVLLELEARLRRLARALPDHEPQLHAERRGPGAIAWSDGDHVERMTAFVGAHYREPLTVESIADAVGLHPNYAMSLFKRACGISLWDYVMRTRIACAQRLLVTTNDKILRVALDAGFGSVSRFYDAFQKTCGQTPRRFRLTHRAH